MRRCSMHMLKKTWVPNKTVSEIGMSNADGEFRLHMPRKQCGFVEHNQSQLFQNVHNTDGVRFRGCHVQFIQTVEPTIYF